MKENEEKREYSFFESALAAKQCRLKYWIFKKGILYPIAIIEILVNGDEISIFKKYQKWEHEIMEAFNIFTGRGS